MGAAECSRLPAISPVPQICVVSDTSVAGSTVIPQDNGGRLAFGNHMCRTRAPDPCGSVDGQRKSLISDTLRPIEGKPGERKRIAGICNQGNGEPDPARGHILYLPRSSSPRFSSQLRSSCELG